MSALIRRGVFACLAVILVGSLFWIPAKAQFEQRYFPETGHTITGEFLAFYEQASDPQLLYGYPITEAFINPYSGRLTQYFERTRFELYPDEPAALRVKLSLLGVWLYEPGQQRVLPDNSPGCQTYQEVEGSFQVCYAFLDFFKAYGGVRQFGYPISNLEVQDGRFVQYFQKARFEWHAQQPSGQRVKLSDLGSRYFAQQAYDPSYLYLKDNLPQTILSLSVRATPERIVTGLQGRQVLHVIVQDQNLLPVAKAEVTLTITSPNGEQVTLPIKVRTNEKGLARLSFPFQTDQPGLFRLQVTASLEGLQNQAISSFRAWY